MKLMQEDPSCDHDGQGLNLQHREGSICSTHQNLQTMLINDQGHPAIRPLSAGVDMRSFLARMLCESRVQRLHNASVQACRKVGNEAKVASKHSISEI